MITVYYIKVSPSLEEDAFFSHLEKTEEGRRKKILGMTDKKSRIHGSKIVQFLLRFYYD